MAQSAVVVDESLADNLEGQGGQAGQTLFYRQFARADGAEQFV
jgi:hypothetical protein